MHCRLLAVSYKVLVGSANIIVIFKWERREIKTVLTFIVSLVVLSLLISFLQFIPMCWSCVFVPFFHEATIRSWTVHTVVRETDQFTHLCVLYIGRRYAWLCFQKDRLHSADATTIPVGSFRRALWMFLYEAYFVWLPRCVCAPVSFSSRTSPLVPISRWSSSCPRQCITAIQFPRTLYWRREQVVFLALLYALVVIRQNFAQLKEIYRRHCVFI